MKWFVCLWVLVVSLVLPSPALAAVPMVSLEVDVSALPEDEVTEALVAHIVADGTETLQAGGIGVATGSPTRLMVTVSRYGEHDVHYRTSVTLIVDDESVARIIECELCRDSELVEQIGKEIARLSGRVLYSTEDQRESDVTVGDPSESKPAGGTAPTVEQRTRPRLRSMGKVGIGAMVGGMGSLAVGIPLALLPDQARITAMSVEQRTTHSTGLALVGVGSVLMVTGIVLVAVDVALRKKQRRLSVTPTATPAGAALSMGVRF